MLNKHLLTRLGGSDVTMYSCRLDVCYLTPWSWCRPVKHPHTKIESIRFLQCLSTLLILIVVGLYSMQPF